MGAVWSSYRRFLLGTLKTLPRPYEKRGEGSFMGFEGRWEEISGPK